MVHTTDLERFRAQPEEATALVDESYPEKKSKQSKNQPEAKANLSTVLSRGVRSL